MVAFTKYANWSDSFAHRRNEKQSKEKWLMNKPFSIRFFVSHLTKNKNDDILIKFSTEIEVYEIDLLQSIV